MVWHNGVQYVHYLLDLNQMKYSQNIGTPDELIINLSQLISPSVAIIAKLAINLEYGTLTN